MIRRLYVHNCRCLENFELSLGGHSSALLIGDNGAGKSTVSFVLQIFQKIARGVNRVEQLIKPKDLAGGASVALCDLKLKLISLAVCTNTWLLLNFRRASRNSGCRRSDS